MSTKTTNQLPVPRGTLTPTQREVIDLMAAGWELVHEHCINEYVFLRKGERRHDFRMYRTFEVLRDRGCIVIETEMLHTTIYKLREGL